MFNESDAKKMQCRVIPMLILPGNIAGQIAVQAPNCAAGECMHWRWFKRGSAVTGVEGLGFCGLDVTPPLPDDRDLCDVMQVPEST